MGRPSTWEKLLDCAEDLFGRYGLEGVSLRTINTEAGLSPAALHYHFGNKAMLVEALLKRRMPALMKRRSQLLDELSGREQLPSTRDALSTLLVPLVDMVAEGGEHSRRYLRLIHRLHTDHDLDSQFVIDRWPGSVTRLVPLLRAANPSLPKSIVEFRLSLVIELMLRSLAHGAPTTSEGFEAHVETLLDSLTGGFLAASHGESK